MTQIGQPSYRTLWGVERKLGLQLETNVVSASCLCQVLDPSHKLGSGRNGNSTEGIVCGADEGWKRAMGRRRLQDAKRSTTNAHYGCFSTDARLSRLVYVPGTPQVIDSEVAIYISTSLKALCRDGKPFEVSAHL